MRAAGLTTCGCRTSSRGSSALTAASAGQRFGRTSTGTRSRPVGWATETQREAPGLWQSRRLICLHFWHRTGPCFVLVRTPARVCDTGHGAFAPRAIYLREPRGILSFKQEKYMRNQLHELSIDDLDEVSGGIAYGPSITPSIPIPPPALALFGGSSGPARRSPEGTARSTPHDFSSARS